MASNSNVPKATQPVVVTRPAFWLKVRKEYIVENFNDMLVYLRDYEYVTGSDNVDYLSTLDCLCSLADEYIETINESRLWAKPQFNVDTKIVLRLLGAAILATRKASRDCSRYVIGLLNLLLFSDNKISTEYQRRLWEMALRVIKGYEIANIGLMWSDVISEDIMSTEVFLIRFGNTEFDLTNYRPGRQLYYEGLGLMMITDERVALYPDNLADFDRRSAEPQLNFDNLVNIDVPAGEAEKLRTFDELFNFSTRLLNSMASVTPSPETVLKDYMPGDFAVVRIIGSTGLKFIAETIDTRYNTLKGKILIKQKREFRVDNNFVFQFFKTGNVLLVKIGSGKEIFELSPAMELFYRERACALEGKDVVAVYSREYNGGSQWISNGGIRIGVDDNALEDNLSEEELDEFDDAIENGHPLVLKVYDMVDNDIDRNPYMNVYALPLMTEQVQDGLTAVHCDTIFLDDFREFSLGFAPREELKIEREELPAERVFLLGHLLDYMARSAVGSPIQRFKPLLCAAMVERLLDRTPDFEYLWHAMQYIALKVDFARNIPVKQLSHTSNINGLEAVTKRERVIDLLRTYRGPDLTSTVNLQLPGGRSEESIERLQALIKASHDLSNIIGTSELNKIKQTIARTLGVEEEFVPLLDERQFYGDESINLEFKSTAVFPPMESRPNPEYQKWNILKAVCGFLNSRSGGELIIGVNDMGYAVGVADDINALVRSGHIKIANMDNYRIYIQSIIDNAFKEYNGNACGKDIVAMNVTYTAETSDNGFDLLRVAIKPYPYDAVLFAADNRPDEFQESYVRRSGRTTGITPAIRAEIEKYKLQSAASRESDIVKLRQAVKDRNVVMLRQYGSSSGVMDREVELYKIWENRGLIYGYDPMRKSGRLFKLSRCQAVEVTDRKWINAKAAKNVEIDLFGMLLQRDNAKEIKLLLNDYAARVLMEEYPEARVKLKSTTQGEYVYQLTTQVSSLSGITRFCLGMTGNIKIMKGAELKEKLKELATQVINEN